jgi:branched-chain amino acid transport system ATP-binding protein
MLAIGRALLLNPKLVLLDEPSQGLAPLLVREVFNVIAQMRREGISILVLDDGRVVYEGPAAEFARDEERVRELAGASSKEWEPRV